MTMRLDIVTNDAGELVRREHARELGSGVVVSIYRLAKLAQMHDLTNQAFVQQLEQTHQIIGDYCLRSGSNVSVLFADKATFVAGQLLKGNRGAYDSAQKLGELFYQMCGASDLFIQRDITREELYAFAEQISHFYRQGASAQFRSPTNKIRLRPVNDAARLRGIELENLTDEQRIVRAYASAVVIMRRFFEDLNASRYILPRRIKRIAQSLVDLSDASTAAFLGVTEVRNANFDEAGRAVNTAILAVAIARETTSDRTVLSQIAMAAMMHDVARPRALALASAAGPAMPGMAGPTTLSEDQEDRLAAGAAAVLTALGRVNEPSITRTVLTFESLWLRRQTWLGPVYWGARPPTLHATMIAIARRYNDLLTPEPGLLPPTPDFAVATLANELRDPQERTVLRMLVSALGLLPTGTVVQLSTGEVAEVVRGAKGLGDKPRVTIVADPNGQPYAQQAELELAQDPRRTVLRVLSVDGWKKGLDQNPNNLPPPPDSDEPGQLGGNDRSDAPPPQMAVPPPAAAAPAAISPLSPVVSATQPPNASRSIADQYADQFASWGGEEQNPQQRRDSASSIQSGNTGEHHSSANLPSMGSSPSAVAEAMGRMINDSLRPPAVPPKEADRTVMSPGPDEMAGRPTNRPSRAGGREPTARGNLAATPLPHVLVYMLDHALTGSVVFEGTGNDETLYFVHGVPAKVRLGEPVVMLGEVLVQSGALDPAIVENAVVGAQRLQILFGEYLVGEGLITREALAWALEAQLLQKIAHLANLAPEITYAYYRDVDLLEGWGGEVIASAPLNPILASVRHWQDRARVRATLNRIGKHPLVLHPDSDLSNLAVMDEEQTVLEAIRAESMPLHQLFKQKLADDEVVSSLVYSLAVTRQFAFKGQKKGPMAARGAMWRNVNAPGSGAPAAVSPPVATPSTPSTSGSRPALPAAQANPGAGSKSNMQAVAAAGGAEPPVGRTPSGNLPAAPPPSSRLPAPPSGQMRAAPPANKVTPPPNPRGAPPPVSRLPAPTRPGAPQIRPIGAKKATMVGIQPGAPQESRLPSEGARSSARMPVAPSDTLPPGRPSEPPDDAKTIAMSASPSIKDLLAKRGVPAPVPPASSARPKPSPGLPNAHRPPPKAAPPPGAKSSAPKIPNAAPSSNPKRHEPKTFGVDETDEIQIELDDRNGAGVVNIGEAGMADAEAALEAMTSFRLAEAALQRNDTVQAQRLAEKALAGDPTQPDYITLVAWVKALAGNPKTVEESIRTMSKVLIEDPSNERALLYRGRLLVKTNRLHEALADFNELLSTNPHHREAASEAQKLKGRLP